LNLGGQTSLEARDSRVSYGEDPESLSHSVVSAPGRDGRTDGQTESPELIRASAVPAGTAVARK